MLVVFVAGSVMLSGCQGDPNEEQTTSPPTSTPPASAAVSAAPPAPADPSGGESTAAPEPSPASSKGPAANIPVPTKPALADENSKEGLEAFTRYWFELFNYGYATNDWKTFSEVTDLGCGTCRNVLTAVDEHYESGGWIVGGEAEVRSFTTDFVPNIEGSISSFVEVDQAAAMTISEDGLVEGESEARRESIDVVIALWEDGRWVMLDFGPPEGT
jgi:hypothetical protein